jgi:hypothetical protein
MDKIIIDFQLLCQKSRVGHFKFVFSISILIYLTARSSPKSIFVSLIIKLLMVVVKPAKEVTLFQSYLNRNEIKLN